MELSYDGSKYHGWQIQKNAISVQQVVEESISIILRRDVEIIGSGRTDTGVHALKQCVHFDFQEELSHDFIYRLNKLLPKDIAVHRIAPVKDDAHVRFDAYSRAYRYKIIFKKDPFSVDRAYYYYKPLCLHDMVECCENIEQWTDFESFSKVHTDVKTFDCQIFGCSWIETNEGLDFYVRANRFLRGMVRAMVGTLLLVGEGKLDSSGFRKILESRDRKKAGRAVPACGLYLAEVNYPKEVYL
ncbi:MAG: tRNA pseudouridine(38-40) synthase TruA, partial [Pseudomonadota bacterium]